MGQKERSNPPAATAIPSPAAPPPPLPGVVRRKRKKRKESRTSLILRFGETSGQPQRGVGILASRHGAGTAWGSGLFEGSLRLKRLGFETQCL